MNAFRFYDFSFRFYDFLSLKRHHQSRGEDYESTREERNIVKDKYFLSLE